MDPSAFLSHLGEVATSPLAYLAYVTVVGAWVVVTYLRYQPKRSAQKILATFGNDAERGAALRSLVGADPPPGLSQNKILGRVHARLFLADARRSLR
jgi:hypothetical protein